MLPELARPFVRSPCRVQVGEDGAIQARVTMAMRGERAQRARHALKFGDLATFNLRFFMDFNQKPEITKKMSTPR